MPETNPYESRLTSIPGEQPTVGRPTTALVLGVFSLIAWCLPIVGLPVSIIGLVLAIRAQKSNQSGRAIAALILNIIGLCLSVFNAALGADLRVRDL